MASATGRSHAWSSALAKGSSGRKPNSSREPRRAARTGSVRARRSRPAPAGRRGSGRRRTRAARAGSPRRGARPRPG
ncbi:hypothetical protein J2Z33_002543 [Rubellimicrobium aerolatum]|nr:hypothetical protein [Rubellimicrobium aerolatum]